LLSEIHLHSLISWSSWKIQRLAREDWDSHI
jgi:hypothetical protein